MESRNNIKSGRDARPQETKLSTSIVPCIYFIRKIKISKIFSTIILYQAENTANSKKYGRDQK